MNPHLLTLLPNLLPLAQEWAESQEADILKHGVPLSPDSFGDAQRIGVKFPEKVRLLKVLRIVGPEDPILRQAATKTKLITEQTIGLTLRYGILIRADCWYNRRLIAHECAHTAQYERLGSFQVFLAQYLRECIEFGYPEAPMEQEAIRAEKVTE